MSASEIERTLVRLAHEIVEKNNGIGNLGLVGIRRRGLPIAERLAKHIERIEKAPVPVGTLDITLYRDDVFLGLPKPEIGATELPESIEGRTVVLVDDVLFTGRTVRAAMDVLADYGRPRAVQLAVLVDRGRRELPIQPDYVGVRLQTTSDQSVRVMLADRGETDRVVLRERIAK